MNDDDLPSAPDHADAAAKSATRAGLLVALGVGFIGMAFGAQAESDGASLGQAMLLSAVMFTGASQFAYLAILREGGTAVAAVASAAVLGLRNTLYGLAVRDYFPSAMPHHPRSLRHRLQRIGASQLTIDESTVVATAAHEAALAAGATVPAATRAAWHGFLAAGLGVYVAWNLGTAVGFLGASTIPDPKRFGLDVLFPAGFLALLAPRFETADGRRVALVALLITALAYPVAPPGVPVLLSAAAILVVSKTNPPANAPLTRGGVEQ